MPNEKHKSTTRKKGGLQSTLQLHFLHSIQSEWLKTRRSAVDWLTLIGGFFIPVIMLAARLLQKSKTVLAHTTDIVWQQAFNQCWQYMAMFLLPLGITLAASLIAQIEYRNNTWKQLFVTPQSLSVIFWAKMVVVLVRLIQFFVLFNIGIYLVVMLPALVYSEVAFPAVAYPFGEFLEANLKFFINSLPILAIQYFLSLHIKNFIIPIAVGFALLLASLIALSSSYGYLFPYCYSSLQYLTMDNKTNPAANIRLWALAYFTFFTLLNYLLFLNQTQNAFSNFIYKMRKNKAVSIPLSLILAAGVVAIFYSFVPASKQLGQSKAEILQRIQEVEQQVSLVKYQIADKKLTFLEERMKHYNVKGLSIAVINDYKIEWAKGYGWVDVATQRPVTPETIFQPGSISKSVHALALLQLHQEKKINLFCDINNYLTSWKFPYNDKTKGRKITLAQLLSHSAGLNTHGFGIYGYKRNEQIPTVLQILKGEKPAALPPITSLFEPGLRFKYSGGGTMLSQQVLMDFTQQDYNAYMTKQILQPLGMKSSFFAQPPPDEKLPLLATGYTTIRQDQAIEGNFTVQPEQAAAGLWTTPTDIANLIINLQKALRGDAGTLLNKQTAEIAMTPYHDEKASMGFFIDDINGVKYFQHGAGNPGFSGKYIGSFEGGKGVVVFVNSDDDPALFEEIINAVAMAYEWEGFEKPKNIVSKSSFAVAPEKYAEYIGYYKDRNNVTSITEKNNQLYYTALGNEWQMHFISPDRFVNIEGNTEKQFVRNAEGKISGYEIWTDDKSRTAQKLTLHELSTALFEKYKGFYVESGGEIDSIYVKGKELWIYMENAIHDTPLRFLSDTDFFLPDGGIYTFVLDEKQKVKGVAGKHNGQLIITRK